ncbi:MAG: urease accessory protein UreD [Leptolyngbyaceae cyanobacterium CRU_2_3]|nr:urease accessory protein UreD [Leptolyngbyaceae cyanobacterium CRU_2_3]
MSHFLSPPSSPASWHGHLQLEFTHCPGETLLSRSQVQAPLKVQRPFYPEGSEVCHTVMLHTAGGIVGGDRLSVDICLNPQSQALITTAAATKIYRSSGAAARQSTQIRVATGACLEWFPQESIVFNGAIYRQDLRVELEAESLWLGWEITRLGRSARGETFLSGEWRSHTEVWQQGRLLWVDPQRLMGGSDMLHSLHGLASYPVIASFALVGQSISPQLVTKARELFMPGLPASGLPASGLPASGQSGTTRLQSGLLCRYRGHSTSEARQWFIQVWHLLRAEVMGRSGCIPRVWPT